MKILQIHLGTVPPYLGNCIDSVKRWSEQNGHELVILTEGPWDTKGRGHEQFLWNRHVADWMRLDYLSKNANTLYIDWDFYVYDLIIPDMSKPCFTRQEIVGGLIYNAQDLKTFGEMRDKIDFPSFATRYKMMELLRQHIRLPHQEFKGRFIHLDNCQYARQQYV